MLKVTDQTASGQVGIRKKSKVPGVMITQFVEEIPEEKSHPDFTRKPIALTIQEGKLAVFKAIVVGEPHPDVTWSRNKGDVSDPKRYEMKFDPVSREHTIEMPNVSPDQADTYKCHATNEYGKAVVTVVLNVIEVGFKKDKANAAPAKESAELKPILKRTSKVLPKTEEKKEGEIDPKFWEVLMSSDKKDYEGVCAEFGVTDFRWMLRTLNQMKKEREEEQAQFVREIKNLKPIEIKHDLTAQFEVDFDLNEPSSRIFIYKDGEMIPYTKALGDEMKHSLKQIGRKYIFTIRDLLPDDAGLYQIDVEGVNIFSTDFKIPTVDFLVKIQEVKAMEREDAVFECVLSNPFSKIMWSGKNVPLEQGEKYDISVSEDKLIHRLVVKDCMLVDKGIYAAVAGIKSCNAWLIVEADKDPDQQGKKKARKTTQAGGSGIDLQKVAEEQQVKLQKQREERIEAMKTAPVEQAPVEKADVETKPPIPKIEIPEPAPPADISETPAPPVEVKVTSNDTGAKKTEEGTMAEHAATTTKVSAEAGSPQSKADSETSKVSLGLPQCDLSPDHAASAHHAEPLDVVSAEEKLQLTCELSDVYAIRGEPAELVCKLSNDKADGVWSKDGEKLSTPDGVTISKDGEVHSLKIHRCKDSDSGQYQFEANECKSEAKVIVGDIPEFDPDDLHKFCKPVIIKVGQNASFKMPYLPQDSLEVKWFKDGSELSDGGGVKIMKEPNHSRLQMKDCLRSDSGEIKIQLKTPFGTAEATTKLIVLDRPGPPQGPAEVIESVSSMIELKWNPPKDDGGSAVTNYIIERQQAGQSLWKKLGDQSADRTSFRDRNVLHGRNYIYRIYAENPEGISDPMETESIMAGTLVFPGPPAPPKVVSAFKNCINLEWAPPENDGGTKILGYQLEKRKKDTDQWVTLNPVNEPIEALTYAVKDVTEGAEYEFRVSAVNVSGVGEPSEPSALVCAKNPNMKPRFKDPVDFMVVRAGTSVRVKVAFEGSPEPEIKWQKDDEPVAPWIQIINVEGLSQLVIPTSKRSDSGIYTITAKNSTGQASFDIEVRVTDEPKRPGPVELEQLVHGKLIISWAPSPDQELDDRLYYTVAEHESNTRVWRTIADRLFCTSFTANIQSGCEYHFRVYAKNDMGLSEPSESPTWGFNSNSISVPITYPVQISFERPPSILVPLKIHTPPKGYQCYMTCAVRGNPAPHISWYLDDISINSNNNFYITNTHGVCSIYICRVDSKHSGDYKVVAVNSLGRAECSTKLVIKD